ncbi:MAG: hypothetical protein AAFX95_04115, partial [Cyanobacteria bacterium J06639_16]
LMISIAASGLNCLSEFSKENLTPDLKTSRNIILNILGLEEFCLCKRSISISLVASQFTA